MSRRPQVVDDLQDTLVYIRELEDDYKHLYKKYADLKIKHDIVRSSRPERDDLALMNTLVREMIEVVLPKLHCNVEGHKLQKKWIEKARKAIKEQN